MVKKISLENPFPGGTPVREPSGEEFIEALREMQAKHDRGELVYVEILDGDRKGSIARYRPKETTAEVYEGPVFLVGIGRQNGWHYKGYGSGTLHWDGRRNTPTVRPGTYYADKMAYLPDYTGPTVWEKFDAKAAKEAILADPQVEDMDGRLLSVGDEVVYINIRYGSGTRLDRGTVVRFDVSVSSKHEQVWTVVRKKDSDEESRISCAPDMIVKLP